MFFIHRNRGIPSTLLDSLICNESISSAFSEGDGLKTGAPEEKEKLLQGSSHSSDRILLVEDVEKPLKSELIPPPGSPKQENTARLRRYRLNQS